MKQPTADSTKSSVRRNTHTRHYTVWGFRKNAEHVEKIHQDLLGHTETSAGEWKTYGFTVTTDYKSFISFIFQETARLG